MLPQKMVLPPTFLYHAITTEEEKGGGMGWLFPQVAISIFNLYKVLFFFPPDFSPELRDGEIFHTVQEKQTREGFRDAR